MCSATCRKCTIRMCACAWSASIMVMLVLSSFNYVTMKFDVHVHGNDLGS